jgi:hypothetical protein
MASGVCLSCKVEPPWPFWPPVFFLVVEDFPLLIEDGFGLLKKSVEDGLPLLVLFDSWFSSPAQIFSVLKKGYDVICMAKKNRTRYTCEDGAKRTVSQIFSSSKKRRGKSQFLLSRIVTIKDEDGDEKKIKVVFVRNRSNRKDSLVLLSTDISPDEQKIIALYGNRWSIEVFFKNCKSQRPNYSSTACRT